MKADIEELQRSYGEIKLFPENSDDLWHLSHLISKGSLVFATTLRSIEGSQDKLRPEKQEKKPVRLGIRVEQIEFHEYSTRLRVFGIIEQGVDIGSHHTLNLEPGYEISVIKKWSQADLDRIDRAVLNASSDIVHIFAIEDGEAELFKIHSFGPKSIYTLTLGSGKGNDVDTRDEFYNEIIKKALSITGPLIIAGPGFIKDDAAVRIKKADLEKKQLIIVDTRRGGRGAVQEVIGQGILEKINGDQELAKEVIYLEKLMTGIAKDEPVAYGYDEVSAAVDCGAVSTLLVSDRGLRIEKITNLLNRAEQMRSEIVIFSSMFEPGIRLEALGGVAALLRYAIK